MAIYKNRIPLECYLLIEKIGFWDGLSAFGGVLGFSIPTPRRINNLILSTAVYGKFAAIFQIVCSACRSAFTVDILRIGINRPIVLT